MRKGLAVCLGAGAVAAGSAVAVYRLRRGTPDVVTGAFGNGMGYARLGTGAKSLLWIGGPSAGAPGGLYLRMMTRMLRPFVQEGYTVWLLSPKPNLPDGCTTADMAEDYARLIAGEFGGKADAAAVLVTLQRPGIRSRRVIRLLAWVVARVGLAAAYEPRDILVSAEALHAFDGRAILPSIRVPVLLVCGEKDRWATKEVYEQTASLIPECTLKMYEGKDHLGVMFDKRLPRDVLDFVRHPRPARD